MADIYNTPNYHSGKTIAQRFWAKVDKNGPIPSHCPDLGPCWLWTGAKSAEQYGKFSIARSKWEYAHRVSYKMIVGPILDELVVDHLCRNPCCVNPRHFEIVTRQENFRRGVSGGEQRGKQQRAKTHCPQGHPYEGANIIWYRGYRACRVCNYRRKNDARKRIRLDEIGRLQCKPRCSSAP